MYTIVLAPAKELPPTVGPTKNGKFYHRTLTATNVCTTSCDLLFIPDRV
jgi:hypothetical protein